MKSKKSKVQRPMSKVFRIIDVNANRAVEGLRVMEEIARFVVENKQLSLGLKKARARLRKVIDKLLKHELKLKHRRALKDLGRKMYTKSEAKRKTVLDIFVANAKRVEEALRVLEEFSKLVKPDLGKRVKEIRFKVYNLEKRGFRALEAQFRAF